MAFFLPVHLGLTQFRPPAGSGKLPITNYKLPTTNPTSLKH